MTLNDAFNIAANGLSTQRTRMETIASNLANVNSTRTPEGGPYQRRFPIFESVPAQPAAGPAPGPQTVRVLEIREDDADPILRFEPGHPDADDEGYVAYPNIDPVIETVDMVSATRSYEANVTMIKSVRTMLRSALDIIR